MQIKKIDELNEDELSQKADALYPLCKWGEYVNTDEELFYQDQWDLMTDRLTEMRTMELQWCQKAKSG